MEPEHVVCPLTFRLLAFVPNESMVPWRFKHINLLEPNSDISELVTLLLEIPLDLDISHIKTLQSLIRLCIDSKLPESEQRICDIAAQFFFFVACVPDSSYLSHLKSGFRMLDHPSDALKLVFDRVKEGQVIDQHRCGNVIDLILCGLVDNELNDRLVFVRYYADIPFYIKYGVEVVIIACGHFYSKFAMDFYKEISAFVSESKYLKIKTLVANDISLFCRALKSVPPRFPGDARFVRDVWGTNEPNPEAGRWMLAFCSMYPVQVFDAMNWVISPSERNAITQLSIKNNWTYKRDELLELFML